MLAGARNALAATLRTDVGAALLTAQGRALQIPRQMLVAAQKQGSGPRLAAARVLRSGERSSVPLGATQGTEC